MKGLEFSLQQDKRMHFDPTKPWFHGSPHKLESLYPGSTITQNRDLARVFSHKPAIVSIQDDGQIKHSGTMPGYLYTIAEAIKPGDVAPHPRTTMDPGLEWLTARALRVKLVAPVEIEPHEQLTEAEINHIKKMLADRQNNPDSSSRGTA